MSNLFRNVGFDSYFLYLLAVTLTSSTNTICQNNFFFPQLCVFPSSVCSLPAGGLISGGGIMGTTMGRLPCSLVLGVELDALVRGSGTPFLEAGKDWELLARSGEASPLSVDGGILGNKFSR